MKFHPDVLAAHAEFGGDLQSMQALYDHPDHIARIAALEAQLSNAYRVKAECNDEANAQRRRAKALEAQLAERPARHIGAIAHVDHGKTSIAAAVARHLSALEATPPAPKVEVLTEIGKCLVQSHRGPARSVTWRLMINGVEIERESARYGWDKDVSTIHSPLEGKADRIRSAIGSALAAAKVTGHTRVSTADLLEWRLEWLSENDPKDGNDCVTPYDKYFYS